MKSLNGRVATVGIGLSRGMWEIAPGAAILHVIKLVAITLGAAGTFRMLGIQGLRFGIGPSLWARRAGLGLILLAVLLSAPLIYKSATKAAEGPVSPDLHRDLRQIVKETIGVDTKILIYSLQKTSTDTQ